jgi:hypothetical protein
MLWVSNLCALEESLPEDYVNYLAFEKQEIIYNNITKKAYNTLPELGNFFDVIKNKLKYKAPEIIYSDIACTCAKIIYAPTRNNYFSGIYESEGFGIISLLLSADHEAFVNIKFFVDESPTLSLSMHTVKNEYEYAADLFMQEFYSNFMEENKSWWRFLRNETKKSEIEKLAMRSINSRLVFDIIAPQQVILIPSEELKVAINVNYTKDFRVIMSGLRESIVLFAVWARSSLDERVHIGNIILQSEFMASCFDIKKI